MTTIHQYRQQKRKHDENESATSSQEERSQKKMLNPVSFPDIGKVLQLKNSRIRFTKKPTQESKDSEKPSTEVR